MEMPRQIQTQNKGWYGRDSMENTEKRKKETFENLHAILCLSLLHQLCEQSSLQVRTARMQRVNQAHQEKRRLSHQIRLARNLLSKGRQN